MSEVGHGLRVARERAGLTRAEAAERLGMSASGLQRWELGSREVRVADLRRLAEIYGTSTAALLGESQEATVVDHEHPAGPAEGSDRELLMELVRAVRASARALELRVTEVEAPEARALEVAQRNIERMMEYLPAPHPADRRDEEAVSDGY